VFESRVEQSHSLTTKLYMLSNFVFESRVEQSHSLTISTVSVEI